ncbi:unnamed protein product [Durusdinium trenchii]|uniref:PDZ domain-containing protein n=1 Tax=Durusdinium trenchii TaxID=1381693 RepID=A0ABP0KJL1_9DINO
MAETTGLGGWFKSTAASLEGHVKEIRENSKLIAADVASNVKDLEKAGRKIQQSFSLGGNGVLAPGLEEVRVDVTFQQGSLGLNLDLESGQVLKITPGGQAEALGLRIEDRVVAVQGEALEGKGAFQEALKQKLAKLPRPVQMTFLRIQQVDRAKDSTRREPKEKVDQELDARLQDMQAKLDAALKDTEAAREEGQSLAAELKLRKSWMAQEAEELEHLRAEAEELRLALEAANSDKEVQRLQTKCRTLEVAEAGSPQAVVLGKESYNSSYNVLSSADFTGRIQKLQAKVGELEASRVQSAVSFGCLDWKPHE